MIILATMEDIEKLRENFKYVYIINHYTFEELTARICSEDTIDGFITEINVCIAQNKIDVLIFDNLDSVWTKFYERYLTKYFLNYYHDFFF